MTASNTTAVQPATKERRLKRIQVTPATDDSSRRAGREPYPTVENNVEVVNILAAESTLCSTREADGPEYRSPGWQGGVKELEVTGVRNHLDGRVRQPFGVPGADQVVQDPMDRVDVPAGD